MVDSGLKVVLSTIDVVDANCKLSTGIILRCLKLTLDKAC